MRAIQARSKRCSPKIYEPRGVRVTTGVESYLMYQYSYQRGAGAWNFCRRFIKSANSVEPLCCRCGGYTFHCTGRSLPLDALKGNVKFRKTSCGRRTRYAGDVWIFFIVAGKPRSTGSSIISFSQCQNGRHISIFNKQQAVSRQIYLYINRKREERRNRNYVLYRGTDNNRSLDNDANNK